MKTLDVAGAKKAAEVIAEVKAQDAVAARIAAMKARAKAAREFREAESARIQALMQRFNDTARELHVWLQDLDGIPVKATDRTGQINYGAAKAYMGGQKIAKDVATIPVSVELTNYVTLITFTVRVEGESGKITLLHDDTEIAASQALDLATAVVEAHFDEGETADAEQEIPF